MTKLNAALKKILKFILGLFLIFVLFISAFFYYFFIYPAQVAESVTKSLTKGQSVILLFDPENEFMQQLNKNSVKNIYFGSFRVKDPKPGADDICGAIAVQIKDPNSRGPEMRASWDEKGKITSTDHLSIETKDIRKYIENRRDQISSCGRLSVTYMPNFPRRCTVDISFDSSLSVTSWTQPECWD